MFLTIDTTDPRPIYQQVADGIKALIAHGRLAEGAPLPPLRQVAADLGVNLNTIATAYRTLQDAGLIAVRHGSGAVVASQTSALTDLILAGLPTEKIARIVMRELKLAKESK
jgi:DNA-binding transcriptional regulator YhcF (GntR family)